MFTNRSMEEKRFTETIYLALRTGLSVSLLLMETSI